MKKVLVFGTFDGLHSGHVNFFKQAKRYGNYLSVVVARDVTVKKTKHRLPQRSERERLKEVKKCKLVNQAVLGHKKNYYQIIKEIKPEVICLGYDQKFFTKSLKKELKKMALKIEIYRMKPYQPEKFHSTLMAQNRNNERRKNFN